MNNLFYKLFLKYKIEIFYILIAIYFVLCVVYAYERMLNTDCSLQLFQVINFKNFFFQENRFGVWLTQVPLLLAVYLHIPIKFLIYIYSISFPLEYLLIIFINYKIFKSKEAALATILSLIVGVAFTFFHSITETHQLLALSCLLFGLMQAKERFKRLYVFYIILSILLFWCLFTHPNAIFTIFFIVGLAFLQKKITNLDAIFSLFICIIFTLMKIILTNKESYDARQYEQLLNFKETIPNFFSLYSFRYLYTKITTIYFFGLCIIIIVWLKYKKIAELLFCSVCFLGFTVLTILTFSNGDCDAIMEKSFMPGFFMFIILYSIYFYQIKSNKIIYIITLLFALLSFVNIVKAGKQYTSRLNLLSNILEGTNYNNSKIIVNCSDFDQNISKFNYWATSLDALLLSSSRSDTSKTIFMVDDKLMYVKDTTDPNLFLFMVWSPYKIKQLNNEYFKLPLVPYTIYKKPKTFNLKAINGMYVCADLSLNRTIIANRQNAWEWETFTLVFLTENKIAIKSFDNHYLSVKFGDKFNVVATSDNIGKWETLSVIKLDSNFIAFKAANEKFIAIDDKTLLLYAKSNIIGDRERFEIIGK